MIRVFVVDEVRTICEMISTVLRSEPDLEVVGCASSLDEAARYLGQCELAVVNASMTNEASVRLVRGLRRLAPQVKIVVMGLAHTEQAMAQCMDAGVAGYVWQDSSVDELLLSLHSAARTENLVVPTSLAGTLMSYVTAPVGLSEAGVDRCTPHSLTRREREVLGLLRQGMTNQEIASLLVIELGTVKNHVHNILRKLKVSSRRDAVHVSRLAGLWTSEHSALAMPRRPEIRTERPSLYSRVVGATN